MQACNDSSTDSKRLVTTIRSDAGLSARLLHAARSPLYRQFGDVTDLQRVVTVVGLATVKAIALTASVVDFYARFQGCRGPLLETFWYRSLHCACLARTLAPHCADTPPESFYLTGLLHRVGQLVLMNDDPPGYARLLRDAPDAQTLLQQEAHLFRTDQVELGAWLLGRWGLDPMLADAVRYQHEPTAALLDAPGPVRLLNLAARLGEPAIREGLLPEAGTLMEVEQAALERHLEECEREVERTARSLGMAIRPPTVLDPDCSESAPDPHRLDTSALREATLVAGIKGLLWDEALRGEPLAMVRHLLELMFGIEHAALFLQQEAGTLNGIADNDNGRDLDQIRIRLERGRSLLGDALLQNRPLDSFRYALVHQPLAVADRQVLTRCGGRGLLALPLVARGKRVGVLAVGITAAGLTRITTHLDPLQAFLTEAAELILRRREQDEERRLLAQESRADLLLHVRKIRHEAYNPLGIVGNYLHLLQARLGDDHPAGEDLNVIREEIQRVEAILRGLTDAPATGTAAEGTDVNALLQRLLGVLEPTLLRPRGIQALVTLDPDAAPVPVDGDRLRQVLLNLVRNAAEAMERGGRLELATRAGVVDLSGPLLRITVRDSGPGLPQDVRAHLFRPVLSSKAGEHQGLGLAVAGQLVQEMGGRIDCSTGSTGTTFTLLIPATPRHDAASEIPAQAARGQL